MGRIRTIKPGFWKDEDLSGLPEATHMLAAALLNYADDDGYFNANVGLVKAECCPLREPSVSIPVSLQELSNAGYLRLGTSSCGKQYGQIVHFREHQVISHPKPSKIKDMEIVWEHSSSVPVAFHEESNQKGMEGKGKERKKGGAEAPTKYAFEGKIVRVTKAQIDQWRKAYPKVPDMMAELQRADDYYTETPPKDGKWFFAVSSWLARANEGGRGKPKIDPMFVPAGGG